MLVLRAPRKYVFYVTITGQWSSPSACLLLRKSFHRSIDERIGISRSLRQKILDSSWFFCRFDLLNGFSILQTMFAMNSGAGVLYSLLNRAGLTRRQSCCYNRPLQNFVGLLREFEDHLDFKCNLPEVMIEVHTVLVSRNHFCFVKIFTLTE